MATFVTLSAPSGVGGTIQGSYGTYTVSSTGTVSIDSRDAATFLSQGFNYVNNGCDWQDFIVAPLAATAGKFIASAALSNGALAVANQPDIPRQAQLLITNGTAPVTAGSVSITYLANDGTTQTDTLSAVCGASVSTTQYLSKGVCHITTASISGIAGGTSPWVELNSTAALSLIVPPNSINFAVFKENVTGVDETVGAISTTTLATITPTSAPNGTRTFSFGYSYTSPAI